MGDDRPYALDENDVRQRAHEISQRPGSGSPEENWLRAVDELRAERTAAEPDSRPEPEQVPPFPPNTSAITHP